MPSGELFVARDGRRTRETQQKVELAARTLQQLATEKQKRAAWGQLSIKLFWEDGYLKTIEINDTTTIKDVPAGEDS